MRSEKNRSTLSRPVATAMILLASGLACSLAMAGPAPQSGRLESVQIKGRTVQSVQIDDLQAASSKGTVTSQYGVKTPYFFNNKVIVQATDWAPVQAVIDGIPGVKLGKALGNRGRFHEVQTQSVGAAFEVQKTLSGIQGVLSVEVDSGKAIEQAKMLQRRDPQNQFLISRAAQATANGTRAIANANANIGVIPFDAGSDPASIPSNQWHFTNVANPQRDNNLLESIYDDVTGDGLTGAGVTIGFASLSNRTHLDVDHTELANVLGRTGGYRLDLSQDFDPILDDDSTFLTGHAGIMVAERNNPATANDLQGVAPGASLATLARGPTPLFESQGYEWKMDTIDIKVHELFAEFGFTQGGYNENRLNEFISDSFKNSVRLGRGRKGTIHVFSTGSAFDFTNNVPTNMLADPYTFTPEPWDVFASGNNQIGVSLTNAFVTGPFYVGGQTHQYPIVNDHTSLIMNAVSEDGNIDTFGAVGPGVFASVYAGTGNAFWSGSEAISGRGIASIIAGTQPPFSVTGEGPTGPIPPVGLALLGNTTGASITGGIIALMLEANPSLKVRDIQHIFYESIQESMRSPANKWPNFNSNRAYYFPDTGVGGNASFWQINTGLYNNPTPPLTTPATDPVVNQAIRHSDQYGFGVVDANLAIQKAKNWPGLPQLVLLDSGVVGDVNTGGTPAPGATDVSIAIEDATFSDPLPEASGTAPIVTGAAFLIPGLNGQFSVCVRQNIKIESIVIELTIEGTGNNDLYIELASPTGTRSILALPTTRNFSGQSTDALNDDELDVGFGSGIFNGTEYAYYQHPFLTHKHWGELSGGTWRVNVRDYGPDTPNPEGAVPGADPLTEPGADLVLDLGEIGVPGSTIRNTKTITAYRVKIYGTDVGAQPFLGCDPFATSCPADLNADGVIDIVDLHLFLNWFTSGDFRADLNGDGQIDFGDIQVFLGIFRPGFCSNNGSLGGRPVPGTRDASDSNPTTRPL